MELLSYKMLVIQSQPMELVQLDSSIMQEQLPPLQHSHSQQLWLSDCTHTVNNCDYGFLFFLSFVRVTWEKVVKKVAKEFETQAHTVNNCDCGFLFFLSFVRVTWEKVVKKVAKEFETQAISYISQETQVP